MVRSPGVVALVPDSSVCPFCGQALLDKDAVEHLAHRRVTYESELRTSVEAEARFRADAEISQLQTTLAAEAAKQVAAAKAARADEVAKLARMLAEAQTKQAELVKAEVSKQLAATEEKERAKLEQDFAKREKQLKSTVQTLQQQNGELSRRVERLSAGERGEFNEDDIAAQLMRAFPDDEVKQTRRGQRGADIFETVRFRTNGLSTEAGLIIYECKDTLQWSNSFVAQIKAQAKLHGTPYAVLVSRCFPRDQKTLAIVDDIVVVDPGRVVALAGVMRRMVIESYRAGVISGSQVAKTAELFRYISSTEFRQAFETLTESVDTLDDLLARERTSHQKLWTERGRLYDNISDTVVQIDARFKCILESTSKPASVHQIHRTSA